jgi:hypothetical protein
MQGMRKMLLAIVLAALGPAVAWPQNIPIKQAYVGKNNRVHIVTGDGRDETIPPEKGQDGIENVRVAEDGRTVGWLVDLWASCCVSYSIPIELVIWRDGGVIRRIHPVQAIFGWTFLAGGKEVAFHNAPLHGSETYECSRVDVRTGRELEEWSIMRKTPVPAWVKLLDEQFPMPDPDELPQP